MSFKRSSIISSPLRQSLSSKIERKKIKKINQSIVMFSLSKQVVPLDGGGDLSRLIYKIQASVISISAAIIQQALNKVFRNQSMNSKDEDNLIKTAEVIFLNALSTSGATCIVSSHTCENEYYIHENLRGEYIVTFVALEGDISNTTAPLGSIFAIFRRSRPGKLMDLELMQPGKSILVCGYALYGPVTTLVLALAHGIGAHLFTLDTNTNSFLKSPKKLIVPTRGNYYSVNEGNSCSFDKRIDRYLKLKKDVKKLRLRNECVFTGSLVADCHSIIKHGGIMLKPAYRESPLGNHMLQFFINPLAFIVIEAGGLAFDGKKEVTSVEVTKPRLNCPLYCGSAEDVSELVRFTSNMRSFKM